VFAAVTPVSGYSTSVESLSPIADSNNPGTAITLLDDNSALPVLNIGSSALPYLIQLMPTDQPCQPSAMTGGSALLSSSIEHISIGGLALLSSHKQGLALSSTIMKAHPSRPQPQLTWPCQGLL